ncbi:orange carotenoid protein N-terminal domain-containing protein [Laspinema olomoucense]|uniref:Orange carotenoid protein n=1 Tax=Laspinema olomoucense D3b TaxID=2953688 RepID=A0ABT2NEG2_9CYAN|nr:MULTISPECIES: orange carotenoid protein N-terminal domain-containing protein [unclassified Laspinema]MCT7971548.1 orange carotenoid protein [Laspinema sp. D3d]MCT7980942.1 orange carotenoid protein [Laspinema sp. D3b]MCT7990928.1 orange carotenoid protein [Laspinema sp. D3a]
MTANLTGRSQIRSQGTQDIVNDFEKLSTDDKLAVLYWIYEKMGDSVTPAAPGAAEPNIAPMLMDDYYNLSDDEQLQIMRDIVERKDTVYSHAYGALSANNQLVVWYAWAVGMGDRIVDMPPDYPSTPETDRILAEVEQAEFEEQISIFREIAGGMGYTVVGSIPTQAETGVTPSL